MIQMAGVSILLGYRYHLVYFYKSCHSHVDVREQSFVNLLTKIFDVIACKVSSKLQEIIISPDCGN
jgi:hypothetical protein